MFWFIIGFIVFIAWTIYVIVDDYYDWGEKIGISFLVLIASFLGSLLAFLLSTLIVGSSAEVDYNKH